MGQIGRGIGPFLAKRQRERSAWCYRQPFNSGTEKPTRAQSIRGWMAMGKVYFPKNAPWANDLVPELLRFPAGKNDDQVDVLGRFGRMLDQMLRGHNPPAPSEPWRQPTWDEVIAASSRNTGEARPQRI